VLAAVAVLAVLALPAPALAAARPAGRAPYVVVLRTEGGSASVRAGLAAATRGRSAAVVERAAEAEATTDALELSVGFAASHRYRYALQGFAASLDRAQVDALRRDPRVASVTPSLPMTPTAQAVPAGVERVGASPEVLPSGGDVDVDVAIVDTGIGSPSDPTAGGELNVAGGIDCTGSGHPDAWQDATNRWYGHGTHVAGILGARDNGIGVVGVAPGARLWSVKVFDGSGGSTSTILCGLDWILARRVDPDPIARIPIAVVNMSLRGPSTTGANTCDSEPEHAAVCSLVAAGVTVVVAAGNESEDTDAWVPARYPQVITVSAMNDFDGLPGGLSSQVAVSDCIPPAGTERDDAFSRYSNRGDAVDVAAPGTCVRSTKRGAPGATQLMSGTSMAAPHVAGAVARYLALHPDTAPGRMRDLVVASASYDWGAASDPDGTPDRLLDVDALLAADQGVALWALPRRLDLGAGVSEGEARLAVQRLGGFEGAVQLSIADLDPSVGQAADPVPATLTGLRGLTSTARVDVAAEAPEGEHALVVGASAPGLAPTEVSLGIDIDRTPPTIGSPWPSIAFRRGTALNATASTRLDWTAQDVGGRVAHLVLQRAGASGPFTALASTTANHSVTALRPGGLARFRVRATDAAGNVATSIVLSARARVRDSAGAGITWAGSWRTRASATAHGGSMRSSATAGAQAGLTFTGRAVAWVAELGRSGGTAQVVLDGERVATIDLRRASVQARRIVYASPGLEPGRHSIAIRVLAGRVDVDAFLVLE
jgi:subtilisin family serine protease